MSWRGALRGVGAIGLLGGGLHTLEERRKSRASFYYGIYFHVYDAELVVDSNCGIECPFELTLEYSRSLR